jgi:hypothetical protein
MKQGDNGAPRLCIDAYYVADESIDVLPRYGDAWRSCRFDIGRIVQILRPRLHDESPR